MKCGFGQNSLAGQNGPSNSLCHFESPIAKLVSRTNQSYEEPGVRDDVHLREKPLREERSGGPITVPAYFIHGCSLSAGSLESVVSRDSRTTRPTGSPMRRATCRRRSRSSLGRRTVSVLPISENCNTPLQAASTSGDPSSALLRRTQATPCWTSTWHAERGSKMPVRHSIKIPRIVS